MLPRPRRLRATLVATATVAGLSLAAPALAADPGAGPDWSTASTAPSTGVTPAVDPSDLPDGWSLVPDGQGGADIVRQGDDLPVLATDPAVRLGDGTTLPTTVREDGTVAGHVDDAEVLTSSNLTGVSLRYGRLDADALPTPRPGTASPQKAATPTSTTLGTTASYATRSFDYTRGSVVMPGLGHRGAVRGHIVAPVGAPGDRPVILFLHGRHDACYDPTTHGTANGWPCPSGSRPVPSLTGYEYAQQALAARGYFTVSVDANAANATDWAALDAGTSGRGAVVRANLRALAAYAADPTSAPWRGKGISTYDLGNTQLVGHSRGGSGVNQAALDSKTSDPWRVTALTYVAPTNFERLGSPTIPSVSMLPTCDGDVIDLEGQVSTDAAIRYGDGSALHTSLIIPGANHNYFNTEWTPGTAVGPSFDDGLYGACAGSVRMAPREQQSVLTATVELTARAYQLRDAQAQDVLLGAARPDAPALSTTSAVPVGGNRTALLDGLSVAPGRSAGARVTGQATWCDYRSCPSVNVTEGEPHWTAFDNRDGKAVRLDLRAWQTGGIRLDQPTEIRAGDTIDTRVIVRGRSAAKLRMTLRAADGTVLAKGLKSPTMIRLGRTRRDHSSGERDLAQHWRAVLPADLDASAVAQIDITAAAATDVAVLDVSRVRGRSRLVASRPRAYADVSATPRVVTEGSERHTVHVPVRISGTLTEPAQIAVTRPGIGDYSQSLTRWVSVQPGQRTVLLPVDVAGNTIDSPDVETVPYTIETRGHLLARRSIGTISVRDDDADPQLRVTPVRDHVSRGGTLSWQVSLTRPTERYVGWTAEAVPVTATGRTELRGRDLTPAGRESWGVRWSTQPLSRLGAAEDLLIEGPRWRDTVTVPTVSDRYGPRVVSLRVSGVGRPVTVRGTVG